jgi:hypothetical protein
MSSSHPFIDYRLNASLPFCDTGVGRAQAALDQAHALLCCMQVDPKEFNLLNSDIQWRALQGIEALVSLAHFHLQQR